MDGLLPTGHWWRELWDFKNLIKTTVIPSKIRGGQLLTLTNAATRRTTCDGVHFLAGVDTSNVKFADPYDAVNDWWASFRFKLEQDFSDASSTDMYIIGKYVDATNYLTVFLDATDGKLYMIHREGATIETISSLEGSWTAGTWYHVLVSCSTTNGQRIIIDGMAAQTEAANQTAISLIADICIGARDDGTSTEGIAGVIADMIMDNIALSTANEALLAKGIRVTTPLNIFEFDEGRGTTANDRGSGADNGTLDSSCTWSFGQVRLSCLSLDGIDDHAVSSGGIDISGELSVIWVGKMKSTFLNLAANSTLLEIYIDANDSIRFFADASSLLSFYVEGSNAPKTLTVLATHTIDDYLILVGTVDQSGNAAFYRDGISVDTDTEVGDRSADPATAYIGAINTPAAYDGSKPILIGLIEGELSASDVELLSRRIDQRYNLGIGV